MQILKIIGYPFSLIYGFITSIRNRLYGNNILQSTQFKTPVIVVGNLSVGGTGKTPQIEYLIRLLKNDFQIAVLSRGYKRKTKGFVLADQNATVDSIGDEPFQYYKKFPEITVAVDANRRNGIYELKKLKDKPEVILLDDAFQHRRVEGGLNILLTTYKKLYVDDHMLPSGSLREHISGAKRAQIITVTKCPKELSLKNREEIVSKLEPNSSQNVFFSFINYQEKIQGEEEFPASTLKDKEVLLVTGIANPKPLLSYLDSQQVNYQHLAFPDHHNFRKKDLVEINTVFNSLTSNNKIILTTEKDYVRIFGKLKKLHYIAIKTSIIEEGDRFDNLIKNYVEQSSRDS